MSLIIKNLYVTIEGKEIVKGLNLEVKDNEVVALMGPNGSGKCIDINDLMDNNFLARAGIIAETFLIKNNKIMANLFGFDSFYIFEYNLKNLTKSEKQQFLYALNGRGSNKGLIKSYDLEHIGRGVLKVPLEYSEDIKDFFEKNKVLYKMKKVLIY